MCINYFTNHRGCDHTHYLGSYSCAPEQCPTASRHNFSILDVGFECETCASLHDTSIDLDKESKVTSRHVRNAASLSDVDSLTSHWKEDLEATKEQPHNVSSKESAEQAQEEVKLDPHDKENTPPRKTLTSPKGRHKALKHMHTPARKPFRNQQPQLAREVSPKKIIQGDSAQNKLPFLLQKPVQQSAIARSCASSDGLKRTPLPPVATSPLPWHPHGPNYTHGMNWQPLSPTHPYMFVIEENLYPRFVSWYPGYNAWMNEWMA